MKKYENRPICELSSIASVFLGDWRVAGVLGVALGSLFKLDASGPLRVLWWTPQQHVPYRILPRLYILCFFFFVQVFFLLFTQLTYRANCILSASVIITVPSCHYLAQKTDPSLYMSEPSCHDERNFVYFFTWTVTPEEKMVLSFAIDWSVQRCARCIMSISWTEVIINWGATVAVTGCLLQGSADDWAKWSLSVMRMRLSSLLPSNITIAS